MERNKQGSIFMWALVAALLSQNLLIPVMCRSSVEDQKTYYSPDPHTGSPPSSHGTPPSPNGNYGTPPSHGGGYGTPPSHGGGYGTPPSHGGGYGTPSSHGGGYGTPPSNGGGSYGGSPPSNCGGTPPSGGYHDPPSTPTLTPPSGGYTNTPPISGGGTPSTPSYTPPSYGGSTPSTPIAFTPPSTPIVIPGISVPSPPYVIDPNSPPYPFNYWSTHLPLIWGLFGFFGTLGGAFSLAGISNMPSIPGLGSSMTLQQALSNDRTDGYGALYREGTAALLNSMVDHRFPFTSSQVRDNFISATHSNEAAAHQAHVFKLANEGRLKN